MAEICDSMLACLWCTKVNRCYLVDYERRGCSKALANRILSVSIGVGRVMKSKSGSPTFWLKNGHGGSDFHKVVVKVRQFYAV